MKSINTNLKLAKLEANLGVTDTVDLIRTALPIIIERKATLSKLLLAEDLEGASACAHKTLGSVRLYGTDQLEHLLTQVKTLDPNRDDLTGFQYQISEEFSLVIDGCERWLKINE